MGNDLQTINFRRGLLPIIILQLLTEKDMYGYQLVQETGRQSNGRIITQEGYLYPDLYQLLAGGYLLKRKVPCGKNNSCILSFGIQYSVVSGTAD